MLTITNPDTGLVHNYTPQPTDYTYLRNKVIYEQPKEYVDLGRILLQNPDLLRLQNLRGNWFSRK